MLGVILVNSYVIHLNENVNTEKKQKNVLSHHDFRKSTNIILCILSKGNSRGVQSTEDGINVYPNVMIQDDRFHSVKFLESRYCKDRSVKQGLSCIFIFNCEQEVFRVLEMWTRWSSLADDSIPIALTLLCKSLSCFRFSCIWLLLLLLLLYHGTGISFRVLSACCVLDWLAGLFCSSSFVV